MRKVVAFMAGMFVMACNGGGASSDPVAQTTKPSTSAQPVAVVNILFEGDSTMFGSDVMSCANPNCQNLAGNEPVVVTALLNDKNGFGAGAVSGTNAGVPSSNLAEMLSGGNAQYPNSYPDVLKRAQAKIVVSNHSMAGRPEQFEGYLNRFIDETLAADKIPVLEEPNPVCHDKRPNLDAYVVVMRKVAAARSVVLVHQYDTFKTNPYWETLLPDCVHPSSNGYAVKARNTAQALIPIIQKLRNN
ncbi:SGNH/GDSL hydrolase family protein [Caballeronia sp. AZ7_KS35]|uniref:SGNH/GDSL hydrolase family protein n=1 Tax=Caballeronia sp. AZ7_KS35 TaxID=2921762 RepID=UPI002028B807|nr:SGNH/GDSL hydrolase family protein [Caballeronia sp. AZ7_KS35]